MHRGAALQAGRTRTVRLVLLAVLASVSPIVSAGPGIRPQVGEAEARGQYDVAIKLLTQRLAAPGLSVVERRAALIGRAMARVNSGDFAGAIEDCDAAIALAPHESDAYYLRALARSDSGDYRGALMDLDYIASAVRIYPRYDYDRGYVLYELGDYDQAIADLTRAAAAMPRDAATYYRRARAYAAKGERTLALTDFGTTVALRPAEPALLSAGYRWHGTEAFALGRYREATADFTALLRLDSSDADAAMRLAHVHYAQRNYADVVADVDRVIHAGAAARHGVFPWPGVIDPTACFYDRIVEQYDQGIRVGGVDPYALVMRARANLRLGHKDAALADYAAAVRAIPPGADDSVAAEMATASR